jgi:hypothetical protein
MAWSSRIGFDMMKSPPVLADIYPSSFENAMQDLVEIGDDCCRCADIAACFVQFFPTSADQLQPGELANSVPTAVNRKSASYAGRALRNNEVSVKQDAFNVYSANLAREYCMPSRGTMENLSQYAIQVQNCVVTMKYQYANLMN